MLGRDVSPVEIADIFAAEQRLRKVFPPSPLLNMEFLNQQLGAQVWLKAENLLPSGAYKYRGAMNKITSLIERYGKELRIVTASSGNHGMACALAARNLGVQANVVVPVSTPQIKKDSIRALGANLVEVGATYDESFVSACELAEKLQVKNLVLYHTEDKNIACRKEKYLEEGKSYYKGNLFVPDDLEVMEL